jgi:hypothetical protein
MRVYIESTIPSYLVARPASDAIQRGYQQVTQDWWELKREAHELFTSQVVLDEIALGDPASARLRLDAMASIDELRVTDEALALTVRILSSGLLPASADRDASHIAISSVYEMDVLLTWNCRHIANASIQGRLRQLVQAAGYTLPQLCTPVEMMGVEE